MMRGRPPRKGNAPVNFVIDSRRAFREWGIHLDAKSFGAAIAFVVVKQ